MNSKKDLRNANAPVDINIVKGITAQEAKIGHTTYCGLKSKQALKNYRTPKMDSGERQQEAVAV